MMYIAILECFDELFKLIHFKCLEVMFMMLLVERSCNEEEAS